MLESFESCEAPPDDHQAAPPATEVSLNVYDILTTQAEPDAPPAARDGRRGSIARLNDFTLGAGLGGVFHGAIALSGVEYSFGWCERGTGVYAVAAGANPMYLFRQTVSLGATRKSMSEVRAIMQELKHAWQGASYDLLSRNCCHFCEELAARLEVQPPPGWLNRFAQGASSTLHATQEAVRTMQDLGQELKSGVGEGVAMLRAGLASVRAAAAAQQQHIAARLARASAEPAQVAGARPPGSPLAGLQQAVRSASEANLAAAGQRWLSGVRATTSSLLAQAHAAVAASEGPPPAGLSAAASAPSLGQQQQSRQAAAASYEASGLQQQQAAGQLPAGVQPKLGREYRLSSSGAAEPLDSLLGDD